MDAALCFAGLPPPPDPSQGEEEPTLENFEDYIPALVDMSFNGGTVTAICITYGPVVEIAKHVGRNVFAMDGVPHEDGKRAKGEKAQLLTCVIEDSLGRIYPLSQCYCFSENATNLGLMVRCTSLAGFEINQRKHVVMSDRSKASFKMQPLQLPLVRPATACTPRPSSTAYGRRARRTTRA